MGYQNLLAINGFNRLSIEIMNIPLKTPIGSSEILIKKGLLQELGSFVNENYPERQIAVITDQHVDLLYRKALEKQLPEALILTVPAGEESKCFAKLMELCAALIKAGFTRQDVIIGFGGGMITDLAGLTASLYMRGIPYIAMPTSLLAMVDAAIGGKTGIDFHAKNIVGTFYLADTILIDPDLLQTFDQPHLMPGMAEVIKYGCIMDTTLFEHLQKPDPDLLTLIEKSVCDKIEVVSADVKEGNRRKILNYGHTFGHAIEAEMHYEISHDHAISIGMMLANQVAQNLGKQSSEIGEKIKKTLEKFHLPTKLPHAITIESLVSWMKKDKKRQGIYIDFIIVPEIGKSEIVKLTPDKLIELVS